MRHERLQGAGGEEKDEASTAGAVFEDEFIAAVGEIAAEYPSASQTLVSKILEMGHELVLGARAASGDENATSRIPQSYKALRKKFAATGLMPDLDVYIVCQGVVDSNGKLTRNFSRSRPRLNAVDHWVCLRCEGHNQWRFVVCQLCRTRRPVGMRRPRSRAPPPVEEHNYIWYPAHSPL